ncbi:molybdopterin-guanine dinucleotide biosynthesis protein B [Cognatishimia activa]|uniref:Molybdenum cofactor biosynthesis adapter protein n=1 Tax=Cognatishimia activa TaxID=1715691 RepID=A0A0P1IR49_9RHOB|nr:molybdopterin-guanine dinucleotide biosynthesis protein B [Cognatishimia activa]CUJ04082.1 Molybdenum cofactor biosynthesis adapter protein [Cognatishimia activa]CUK26085.1 Molybdenum cofactor biosynthesis adapter protein [Cognatishimia activa]
MKVFGVTGWKNNGKTTLVAKLVAEITSRGFTVSTVKRTHHSVDLDTPGTDTFKHRQSGANEVMLASDARYAILKELSEPPSLAHMISRLSPVDLVLVEGFKSESHDKIECHRKGGERPLICESNTSVVAVATDAPIDAPVPLLAIDDIVDIADFVLAKVGLEKGMEK